MEAVAAISLAANIAQFVDIGFRIFHGSKEMYQSPTGMTAENLQLENITKSLRLISLKLDPPVSAPLDDDEQAVRRLATDCRVLSDQLLEILQGVIAKDPTSKRQVVCSMLKNIWTRKERLELERRLSNCRNQLELQFNSMASSKLYRRINGIGMTMDTQLKALKQIHKHIEELKEGTKCNSISSRTHETMSKFLRVWQGYYDFYAKNHILKELATPDMNARFDDVVDAHTHTFRWLFAHESAACSGTKSELSPQRNSEDWSVWQLDDGYEEANQDWWYKREEEDSCADRYLETIEINQENRHYLYAGKLFLDWLASGTGVFHISGKLGSGKSTLMKFLVKHPRTKRELANWAGTKRTLVLIKFFFWRPGSKGQKSLNGFFRSLLWQILLSCSSLVEMVFPDLWHQIITCPWQVQPQIFFSDDEIRTAIARIFRCKDTCKTYSFCLFIDGLDEYQETLQDDYKVLISTLKEWVHLCEGGLKICVSSREYNVFENAFPAGKRIRLQDLTKIDMERYARNMLEGLDNEEQKSRLVSEIVSRADGIFLWVALVVKMFRDYIEDEQDFATFDDILDTLPDELESLFEHLLVTMHKPARKRAYQTFALINHIKTHYDNQLFLLSCIFLEKYERDKRFALGPMTELTQEDVKALERTAQKRLNGICRGLVEVKETALIGKYIAFTHRSVPEFLEKESTRKVAETHTRGFDFADAVPQIFLAYLRCMKKAPNHSFWAKFVARMIYSDFDSSAPYPYLSCLESAVVGSIGSAGTLAMNCERPLDQQMLIVVEGERHYINFGRCIGNFFLVSPFYLSACFGKLEYVMFRIGLDSSLVDEEHKRALLTRCLSLNLGGNDAYNRFHDIIAQRILSVDGSRSIS